MYPEVNSDRGLNGYHWSIHRKGFLCTSICFILDKIIAMFALADTVKSEARLAIRVLKDISLDVVLLTGDNQKTANTIARQVLINFDQVHIQKLP